MGIDRELITVIGSGGWGTAIACLLAAKPSHRVRLWCANPQTYQDLSQTRENRRQLAGVRIPEAVELCQELPVFRENEIVIVAVPTIYLTAVLSRFLHARHDSFRIISLTKGITFPEFERPSEIIQRILRPRDIAVLSGPNHAEEIARGLPASAVVASSNAVWAESCRELLGTSRFRIYSQRDVIGVELAGAYKNVLAIAAGLSDGLLLGDNAKAALLTRGLVEMTRFGLAHGADAATFAGLAGMGDLITTCFSRHGRNRKVGERIALGESIEAVTAGPMIAEGINTAKSIDEHGRQIGIDCPIAFAVHGVLYRGVSPHAAMQDLMSRSQKNEVKS
jgi:glycerol-3-phosphate dehydrogenase (NAD(P)+)